MGASASYAASGISHSTALGKTTDPDVLILNPSAPITPVYLNSDAWTGRSRCDIQGGVLFEAPITAGFVVPGASVASTPNHAVAILDADGTTLIQGQPYTHCTADGPVTMWWFQKDEQIDGIGVSRGPRGSLRPPLGRPKPPPGNSARRQRPPPEEGGPGRPGDLYLRAPPGGRPPP